MKEALKITHSIGKEFSHAVRDILRIPQAWNHKRQNPSLETPIVAAHVAESPKGLEQLPNVEASPPVEVFTRSVLIIATRWDIPEIHSLVPNDTGTLFEVDDYIRAEELVGLENIASLFNRILIYSHGLKSEERPIARIIEAARKQGYSPNKILRVVQGSQQLNVNLAHALICSVAETKFIQKFLIESVSKKEAEHRQPEIIIEKGGEVKIHPKLAILVRKTTVVLFHPPAAQAESPVPPSRPEQPQANPITVQPSGAATLDIQRTPVVTQIIPLKPSDPVARVNEMFRSWLGGTPPSTNETTAQAIERFTRQFGHAEVIRGGKVAYVNPDRLFLVQLDHYAPKIKNIIESFSTYEEVSINVDQSNRFARVCVRAFTPEDIVNTRKLLTKLSSQGLGVFDKLIIVENLDKLPEGFKASVVFLARSQESGTELLCDPVYLKALFCKADDRDGIIAFLRGETFSQPTESIEIQASRTH